MIRAFVEEDIPQVSDLHRRVFKTGESTKELSEAYRRYLAGVFLRGECQDGIRSLVSCEAARVTGFLGAVPRRLEVNGSPILGAVSSQFIVEPESRGVAGLKLLRTFLNGPQDISIADESNADSRQLWEALGGSTSLLHSIQWLYPLRPFHFGLWVLRKKGIAAKLGAALSPFASAMDAIVSRLGMNPYKLADATDWGADEELPAEFLESCPNGRSPNVTIRPNYDASQLRWLMERAGALEGNGELQKVLVKSGGGTVAGWYIYYSKRHGVGEVLQLHSRGGFERRVFDHLIRHAGKRAVAALRGRFEPAMAATFSERNCVLHSGHQWVLVHSRCRELLQTFQTGATSLSRLDGEWCLHFR